MTGPAIRWNESDVLDVVQLFKEGEKVSAIARKLTEAKKVSVSRHRVVALLQRAFASELVSVPLHDPRNLAGKLARRFEGVCFRVVGSPICFSRVAGLQVLEWLRGSCAGAGASGEAGGPFVAVGGGQTMAQLIEEVPGVLRSPEHLELKQWFGQARLTLINATAGGLATRPELEASFLTCRLAQALREGCGDRSAARPVVHSASLSPSPDEWEVLREAFRRTRVVVSGIGSGKDAYCVAALRDKGLLASSAQGELVGEFLFHPYGSQAQAIPVRGLAVKKVLDAPEAAGRPAGKRGKRADGPGAAPGRFESPMLVTLFHFEELRGRPRTKEGRSVIVVASCTATNKADKARALCVLLENHFLTHVCLSAELAEALDRTAGRPDR
jgi:hypothetical protein